MNERLEEAIKFSLPAATIARTLPIAGPPFQRPDPAVIRALSGVSSATASALMHRMGVRQTFIAGALPRRPGTKVVGLGDQDGGAVVDAWAAEPGEVETAILTTFLY